ncbi:MAG TPA: hypothetical protein VG248_04970 [Caulobacteraceae bacterium]|jgi:hypothetical protein|nr:hypothetical protein [Caulobacteraceae bacterium]
MRVSEDVFELAQILNEAGFGELAGELISEIGVDQPEADEGAGAAEDGFAAVPSVASDQDQLREALQFIALRLVEPMRRINEATNLASELSRNKDVVFKFVRTAADQPGLEGTTLRADPEGVDAVDRALQRLVGPGQADGA